MCSRDDDIWVGLLARKHVQLPSADAWLKMVLSADLNTRTQQVLVVCNGICGRSHCLDRCSPLCEDEEPCAAGAVTTPGRAAALCWVRRLHYCLTHR